MPKSRLLLALTTKNNDYQQEQAASAEAAARSLGAELQILYAENDTIAQSTQLLRAIQSEAAIRPNGILFEPVGGTALPQVARAAVAAGIGLGVLNCVPDYLAELRRSARCPVFSLSSDHKEIGRIQGHQFSAFLPRGGAVLYIQGPSDNLAAKDRTLGMQSVLASNIHVTALRGQWTEESSCRSVASWLKLAVASKARIDLIAAQNDLMAMGARKAFEALGETGERERWLSLSFTGVDGLPKTGHAWVRTGSLAATVKVPPNAGQAIQMICGALQNGTNLPERSYTVPESFPPIDELAPRLVSA